MDCLLYSASGVAIECKQFIKQQNSYENVCMYVCM